MKPAVAALVALTVTSAAGGPPSWVSRDATPIGRPIAVGGVVVGHVLKARHVYARGLAPTSGKVLWEHEISPSAQPATIDMTPARVGDHAVLLQPEPAFGPDHARLSVLDPLTGRELHRTPAMLFSSRPESCFGARSVCALAAPSEDDPAQGYRLNLDSGALHPYPSTIPRGARSLGPAGLITFGGTSTEQIALVDDGVLRWRRPFAATLPHAASSAGTRWSLHAADGVLIGSGYARGTRTATSTTFDLARDTTTVALDAATGRVLWGRAGALADCGGRLPLTGHAVRCRYRGAVTSSTATKATRHTGLQVVLEGFGPRSGIARWSAPVASPEPTVSAPALSTRAPTSELSARAASAGPISSSAEKLATGDGRLAIADANTVVMDGTAGPILLDLRTGSTAKPARDAVMWCPQRVRFAHREDGTARSGGDVYAACDARGNPVTRAPSREALHAVAAEAGGYAVVATPGGFQGIQVTARR